MGKGRNRSRTKRPRNNTPKFSKRRKLTQTTEDIADDVTVSVGEHDTSTTSTEASSTRARKVSAVNEIMDDNNFVMDEKDYFIVVNFKLLENIINLIAVCPACASKNILFYDSLDRRMGLAHKLCVRCHDCEWSFESFSSPEIKKQEQHLKGSGKKATGRNMFECNVRLVSSFREVGKGWNGIMHALRCLNIYPINENTYKDINNKLFGAYKLCAEESMRKAGEEASMKSVVEAAEENIPLPMIRVSLDGTWQKRGHNSHNGIVSAAANSKILDVEVLSKICKQCTVWEKKKNDPNYVKWKESHHLKCPISHTKSAGAMESNGAVKIFQRSVEKRKLIYKEYLGDGDTSSFKEVVGSEPYKQFSVEPVKQECVGHIQKRVGKRLRDRIKTYKGTKLQLVVQVN